MLLKTRDLAILVATAMGITVASMEWGAYLQRKAYRRFEATNATVQGSYICPRCDGRMFGTYIEVYDWSKTHDCASKGVS